MKEIQELLKRRQFKRAIELCDAMLKREDIEASEEAELLALRGRCKWFLGIYSDAIADQRNSLIGLSNVGLKFRYGTTLIELGMSYDGLPDYNQAIATFQSAYWFNTECGFHELAATSLASLGLAFARCGNHEIAVDYLVIADNLYESAGLNAMRAEFLSRSIISVIEVKGAEEALRTAKKALEIANRSERPTKIAAAYRAYGICEAARGKWEDSTYAFENAKSIYEKEDCEVEVARTFYDFAKSHLLYVMQSVNTHNHRENLITYLKAASLIYSRRGYIRRTEMTMSLLAQYLHMSPVA